MPRKSQEEKARSRARIVEVAAAMFRENGIATTGVADLMKAAGLTHGGFYRHFASKDDLVAAAISHSVSTALAELRGAEEPGARAKALKRYIDRYLSEEHVGNPRDGCPLAALGPEAPRSSPQVSKALDEGSAEAVRVLAAAMDGRREAASSLMATLLGSVVMARMASSHQCRKRILLDGQRAALGIVESG
ncbi:MAG: TetR/AcrR family transcriptional regulator [Verrucomicrobia subdivision 3 bacterium]|nr:TetR/AcrR family transcriptional regulator [Limisphaerales bacterium]